MIQSGRFCCLNGVIFTITVNDMMKLIIRISRRLQDPNRISGSGFSPEKLGAYSIQNPMCKYHKTRNASKCEVKAS